MTNKLTKEQTKRFDKAFSVEDDPEIGEWFDQDDVYPGSFKQHMAEELAKVKQETIEEIFKEILAWAEKGELLTYPSHWFIAGLKVIKDKLKK